MHRDGKLGGIRVPIFPSNSSRDVRYIRYGYYGPYHIVAYHRSYTYPIMVCNKSCSGTCFTNSDCRFPRGKSAKLAIPLDGKRRRVSQVDPFVSPCPCPSMESNLSPTVISSSGRQWHSRITPEWSACISRAIWKTREQCWVPDNSPKQPN